MSTWYFKVAGRQVGPITDAELIEQAENGTLAPHDQIWSAGMSEWVPLAEVLAFEGGRPAPGAQPKVPVANASEPERTWYYAIEGEQDGPVTLAELGELYKRRKLGGEDSVWTEALGQWVPVHMVEALRPFKPVGLAMPPPGATSPKKPSSSARKSGGPRRPVRTSRGRVAPRKKRTVVVPSKAKKPAVEAAKAKIPGGGLVAAEEPMEPVRGGLPIVPIVLGLLVLSAVAGGVAFFFLR